MPSLSFHPLRRDEGSSLIEVAMLTPFLLLLLVGGVDFGRGYFVAMEVANAAESGALYGSLNYTDTTGMVKAAQLDAKDVPSLVGIAKYGCECADGSSAVANCSSAPLCIATNVVNYVEVDTATTYTPILRYPGIPTSFALTGKARMRAGN